MIFTEILLLPPLSGLYLPPSSAAASMFKVAPETELFLSGGRVKSFPNGKCIKIGLSRKEILSLPQKCIMYESKFIQKDFLCRIAGAVRHAAGAGTAC
jgi:hypothetical protein